MKFSKKSQIWVSAVLYFLIATIVITIMLEAGMPLINEMSDKSVFSQTKNQFLEINQKIREVSQEGAGSKRIVPIEIKKGELYVSDESIQWQMETKAKILEPRTTVEIGDLKVYSNTDVKASESAVSYTIENSFLSAVFTKYGSPDLREAIDPEDMLVSLYNKKTQEATSGTFRFSNSAVSNMYGYTEISAKGENLGQTVITYYIYNSTNPQEIRHAIKFTLMSMTDFIKVDFE